MTHSHSNPSDAAPATPSYDDINTSIILMVGIASAIITYLCVVAVQGLTYQMDMNMIRERSHGVQYAKSADAILQQQRQLEANPDIQRIDIHQAMADTVARYAQPAQTKPETP